MVDFSLTPQQAELKERARRFAHDIMLPAAIYYDDEEEFPFKIAQKAFDAGFLNLHIPKKFGGQGYGVLDQCFIIEEFASACAGMTTTLYCNDLGSEVILQGGTTEQQERFLTPLCSKLNFLSFAVSEPFAGSDVAGIQTTARREGDEYILNGTKYWITNAPYASIYVVFARMEGTRRNQGLCAFVIKRENKGLFTGRSIEKLGHRASTTSAIILKEARVPVSDLLGKEGEGSRLATKTFTKTRPIIGAMAYGVARSAMEYAIKYANRREAFQRKIASFETIQTMIADMYMNLEAMRNLTWKAAWSADQNKHNEILASCSKAFSADIGLKIVQDALQIFGGRGYTKNAQVEKLYRDAKLYQIYEGTSQIQRLIISRYILNQYEGTMVNLKKEAIKKTRKKKSDVEEEEEGVKDRYVCIVCGYEHDGPEPPEICPLCGIEREGFIKIKK